LRQSRSQALRHKDRSSSLSGIAHWLKSAPTVEPNCIRVDVRIHPTARVLLGELRCQLQHPPSISTTLQIVAHGNAAKQRDVVVNIDTNDADGGCTVPQNERVVVRPMLVGMLRIVRRSFSTKLEQHSAANRVIRRPISRCVRGAKLQLKHSYFATIGT
jgi:hypothetical protein